VNDSSSGEDIPRGIAAAITEVSERATLLVREEIELAKAEVTEKATKLARGAVIGIVAGIFLVTALFFFLIGCAWLLYFYLPVNDFAYFWGFFAMAVILVFLGLLAGLIAARALKRGAPPTPDMAIEEARRIRETVSSSAPDDPAVTVSRPATAPSSGAAPSGDIGASPAPAPAPASAPAPYGAAAPHTSAPPASSDPEGAA
jgi:hypothetical protein